MDNNGPTGILRERACELIMTALGRNSHEELTKYVLDGLDVCARVGLTGVQTNDSNAFAVYQQLMRLGKLPIRVFLTPNQKELYQTIDSGGIQSLLPIRPACFVQSAQCMRFAADSLESHLLIERVKIYSDGSLGAETAALRVPMSADNVYSNNININSSSRHTGVLINRTEDMMSMISDTIAAGFRLEIHAIGDAAAEQV